MSGRLILARVAGTASRFGPAHASFPRSSFNQIRLQSTGGGSTVGETSSRPAAKGPRGPEAQPQGSDQRGKTTTYALPIVAVLLVTFAVIVRVTSSDTKQAAVGTAKMSDGENDKIRGSKAKSIAADKANAEADKMSGK